MHFDRRDFLKSSAAFAVAAGLPQLLGQTGRAKSYAERLFEFVSIAEIGQIIFRNEFSGFQFIDSGSRELVKIPCLANQVQCDVGNCDVLFKYGSVPCPFTVPVAKNQCIICLVNNII